MSAALAFLGAIVMAACGPRQPDADAPPPPASIGAARDSTASQAGLVNTYWRITTLDTMSVPAASDSGPRAPHLQLTERGGTITYSATVGCNGIGGDATINGDSLTFGPGIGTKMYCEVLNALEVQLQSVLTGTRSWSITGDTLELRDGSGNQIARLVTGPAAR